jgi:cytidylate kinase
MSVITISRGSFSGGKMLAECLAHRLGYRCVDRDVIVERAAASGVSQDELLDALLKPPTFLERFGHKRYLYLALIQAALAEEIRTGRVVYHGNAGHLLLKGASPVLRVRIIAPLEFRLAMLEHRLKISREEGIAYIQKVDEGRRKWTQFLYGVSWEDPAQYDLVINLEHLAIDEACDVLEAVVKRHKYFQFTEEHQAALEDLALASRTRAQLAIDPSTSHLEVEVTALRGAVRIKGKLTRPEELEDVRRVALAVPGLTSLNLDELTPGVHV